MSSDMNSTTWGPTGESSLDVFYDSTNLIGTTVVCGFTYGIVFTMFCICFYYLVLQLKGRRARQVIFNMVYISITFVFATMYVAASARTTQLAYVNNRNFPGGPNRYAIYIFDQPVTIFGLVAFFAANWFTDALLIWRLWVLYQSTRYGKYIIGLPSMMFLTSVAMSIVTIVQSSEPSQSFWSNVAVKFALAYYSLTVALTVLSTFLMICRIWSIRRESIRVLGHSDYTEQYLGIVAMLIESSALYTVWAIIFLGLYIVNHPVQYIFLASLAEVQVLAPMLIIYRVSRGRAWGMSTEQTLTTFKAKSLSSRIVSIQASNGTKTTDSGTLDVELQAPKAGKYHAEEF